MSGIRRIYGIIALLFWGGWGCAETVVVALPPINVSVVKPKESDFRNYTTLKISELGNRPLCEAMNTFPDRLKEEIENKRLFKAVQVAPPSRQDGRQTLILRLSVAEFFPGQGDKGVWWGGHIVVQCSLVEKMTNSEIFICRLRGPLELYYGEDLNSGLVNVSEAMVKQIADIIQQGW